MVRAHWTRTAFAAAQVVGAYKEHCRMSKEISEESVDWLISVIRKLPADEPVRRGTLGYNAYTTQKYHWLGWLDPAAGTGTYSRKSAPGSGARSVYNRIVEPKLLIWLISAANVPVDLVHRATSEAESAPTLAGKSAAIRRHVPWEAIAEALKRCAYAGFY